MLRTRLGNRIGLSLILILPLLAGCGGSGATVSGTATYDKQPIEKGAIAFRPVDGKGQGAGGDIVNGQFTVKNVPFGKNRVEIAVPTIPPDVPGNKQVVEVGPQTKTIDIALEKPKRGGGTPKH
jgi:hypothetical protein